MSESDDVTEAVDAYESPKLTRLGNVRELLAGEGGSAPDGQPNPNDPFQPS
jgi:hypothetical protein